MTLHELEKEVPELLNYTKTMPEELRRLAYVKIHPPGSLIHQKDYALNYLGIVAKGENRVINEFENGKIYMIETNKAIDFIGEVTLLANMARTSVTIEALTANMVVYLPRRESEQWVNTDIYILRKMAERTAFKLYRSSYNNGLKLYYPPVFLLADHLARLYEQAFADMSPCLSKQALSDMSPYLSKQALSDMPAEKQAASRPFSLQKTRERLSEELGMNIKTLDRAIRSMQKDGYFSLVKGKICFNHEEYLRIKDYLTTFKG